MLHFVSLSLCLLRRPLGEQYAAMLTACSIAERVRDEGGHALVVLNDASVMVSSVLLGVDFDLLPSVSCANDGVSLTGWCRLLRHPALRKLRH